MVYKDCNIGSAKPNKNVLEKYPHHLIDIVSPNEVFNVSDFCKYSKKIIEITHSKNKLPIFVGGSMMYFKSLYSGIYNLPERDQEFRESLKKLQSNGNDFFLYKKLNKIDPDYATKIHKNDEVIEQDGVRVLIAPTAQMFLFGTEIDYETSLLESAFKFNNPNVSEACGCGESIKFKDI